MAQWLSRNADSERPHEHGQGGKAGIFGNWQNLKSFMLVRYHYKDWAIAIHWPSPIRNVQVADFFVSIQFHPETQRLAAKYCPVVANAVRFFNAFVQEQKGFHCP